MKINLTEICKNSDWHLATAIQAVRELGMEGYDADNYVSFVFADFAKSGEAEDCVDDEQYDRLFFVNGCWVIETKMTDCVAKVN